MKKGVVKEKNIFGQGATKERIRETTGQKREPKANDSGSLHQKNEEFLKGLMFQKVAATSLRMLQISNRPGAEIETE